MLTPLDKFMSDDRVEAIINSTAGSSSFIHSIRLLKECVRGVFFILREISIYSHNLKPDKEDSLCGAYSSQQS